jgi:hypothetical protein
MPDFNLRSDSVNVEQIMEQIRARIREKRGVDYTEQQIQDLAAVKLEKFLDPRGVRSDLLEQFRRAQPPYRPPELPNYAFEEHTLFESHRAPLRLMRRLLQPILKLFFNPNPLIQALNIQSRLNTAYAEREAHREAARHTFDQLHYEVLHNLVVETTRLGIEVKNLKMRVESLSSRLEFNERRARALESVVVYKPATDERVERRVEPRYEPPPREPRVAEPAPVAETGRPPASTTPPQPEGPGQRSRRRRRRRGRRGTGSVAAVMGAGQTGPLPAQPGSPDSDQSAGSEQPRGPDHADVGASESDSFEGPDSTDSESSDHEQ